jgi:hypothetical protein
MNECKPNEANMTNDDKVAAVALFGAQSYRSSSMFSAYGGESSKTSVRFWIKQLKFRWNSQVEDFLIANFMLFWQSKHGIAAVQRCRVNWFTVVQNRTEKASGVVWRV